MLFLCLIRVAEAKDHFLIKKELLTDWQIVEQGKFIPYQQDKLSNVVHFQLKTSSYRGDILKLSATSSFTLFINNKLISDNNQNALLSMDSLASRYGDFIQISIYNTIGITPTNLTTQIITTLASPVEDYTKASTHFLDFLWIVFALLISLGIILLRFNGRLFSDYFSVIRLFTMRESEDAQTYSRVTSTTVVFYVLTSLTIGLFLLMLASVDPVFQSEHSLNLSSFGYCWLSWFTISGIILLIIVAKIVVIYLFCRLFGFGDEAGYHIFNYIRFLLIVSVLILFSTASLITMRIEYEEWIKNVFGILKFIPVLWILILFFKMTNRVPYTMFHLFCYLCATEIIPQLIITKILFE